ncbi:DUF6766 family protein [Streptomyces sp. NPDC060232]|uniref:DUF6766 family protein n=1 Tax=Streptomyces sp. NPDC060232 TaxID=3347079 RepID=UPI00364A4082
MSSAVKSTEVYGRMALVRAEGDAIFLSRFTGESKEIHRTGTESDREQRVGNHATAQSPRWAGTKDWRQSVYARSPGLVMGTLFILSWTAQSITGMAAYDEQQLRQLQNPVGWDGYLASPDFWNRSLQNRQSELLAVAAVVILSVYLRQRGSPESKPVGAAHTSTGVEG